ncbi:hypothetical protein AB6A40_004299 [Gnathostoma spinigerum]|uniref:Uncharacterized protein n=1 Tax=Gnathostoma spinigerum TaxID=75299 RepID=A0ABD6ED73_9BILA
MPLFLEFLQPCRSWSSQFMVIDFPRRNSSRSKSAGFSFVLVSDLPIFNVLCCSDIPYLTVSVFFDESHVRANLASLHKISWPTLMSISSSTSRKALILISTPSLQALEWSAVLLG